MPRFSPTFHALPLFALVSLSACSGSQPAPPEPPVTVAFPDAAPPPPPVLVAELPPPPPPAEPASPRQVEGFRVQVYASETSAGGEQVRADAAAWWDAEQRRTGFTAPLDAYVVYLDGLYKVRMGAFTNRSDAEAALALVRTRFPDSFLLPDLVTIDG